MRARTFCLRPDAANGHPHADADAHRNPDAPTDRNAYLHAHSYRAPERHLHPPCNRNSHSDDDPHGNGHAGTQQQPHCTAERDR